MEPIDDETWAWLTANLESYLKKIKRIRLLKRLTRREEWQLIRAKTPFEKKGKVRRSMTVSGPTSGTRNWAWAA